MKWARVKDGIAATGRDGTVYKIRRDPLRVEVITPDGEVVTPNETVPWLNEDECKWWCREHDGMRK